MTDRSKRLADLAEDGRADVARVFVNARCGDGANMLALRRRGCHQPVALAGIDDHLLLL